MPPDVPFDLLLRHLHRDLASNAGDTSTGQPEEGSKEALRRARRCWPRSTPRPDPGLVVSFGQAVSEWIPIRDKDHGPFLVTRSQPGGDRNAIDFGRW
jgi:hypothetical protein